MPSLVVEIYIDQSLSTVHPSHSRANSTEEELLIHSSHPQFHPFCLFFIFCFIRGLRMVLQFEMPCHRIFSSRYCHPSSHCHPFNDCRSSLNNSHLSTKTCTHTYTLRTLHALRQKGEINISYSWISQPHPAISAAVRLWWGCACLVVEFPKGADWGICRGVCDWRVEGFAWHSLSKWQRVKSMILAVYSSLMGEEKGILLQLGEWLIVP
jgi:hypothetical protein